MGLETGNTINDLNESWPLGTDPKSQGDDHIRLCKRVFKNDVLSTTNGGTISGDLTIGGAFTSKGIDDNASANAITIDSSGHAIIPAGVTLGTAAGVYNAANTLDDYEEGTWTPDLTDGTNSPSYSFQLGVYTKIGNTVYVKGRLGLTSLGSVSGGNIRISGLPFTVNTNSAQSSVNFGYARFISSVAGGNIVGYVGSNSTVIYLELYDTTSGTSAAQSSDFTANSALMFDATYLV